MMDRVTEAAEANVEPAVEAGGRAAASVVRGALAVRLIFDRSGLQQWHHVLVDRLGKAKALSVSVSFVEGENRLPASAAMLFQLERLAYGLPARSMSVEAAPATFGQAFSDRAADIVLDLSGGAAGSEKAGRAWQLTFDGAAGEAALLAALLARRSPVAEIREGGRIVASARLGTEYQGIASASFEDCLWRTVTLIERALRGAASGRPLAAPMADGAAPVPPSAAVRLGRIAGKTLARGVVRRLYRLCFFSPQWRTGWRRIGADGDLFDLRRHPAGGWTALPDDGLRFYADPFAITHGGRTFLFVEEFPHRTGKGIISAVPFGADGPLGAPEPVLETGVHLSYPFVFEREGEVWMIPESCAAGTVELWRATRFPGGWVKEATLLAGITASDATLVEKDGRWWMLATVRDGGGAFSDALHLWSAPDFRGPFTAHPGNPVLIDSASARPAGKMVERNGVFWRPVQDCRESYGAALGLARVDQLDGTGFAQSVEAIVQAGSPQWPGRRLHTLNRAGDLEFIDGSGPPPRRMRL